MQDTFKEHPVRESHLSMALSAAVHRLLKFGPDETLNEMGSVELLRLLPFVNGPHATWVMSTAFTRAIIEDQRVIIDRFGHLRFLIPAELIWFHTLITTLMQAPTKPEEAWKLVEALEGEEKCVARVVMGRIYPGAAKVGWLEDSETMHPKLALATVDVVAQNPAYTHICESWVRDRPMVRNESFCR